LLNLKGSPENVWREMQDTWRNRLKLKKASGVSMRGADNKKPVLHLTLSWHPGDEPSEDHMKETCLSSLHALDLSEHQVLTGGHDDTEHRHAHMIINTVHPKTGRTATLKYAKERLSRWAQAYEEKHGIRIEQRVANNDKRDEMRVRRHREATEARVASQHGRHCPDPAPYEPIKGNSPNRRQWFARNDIIARMKAMRERIDGEHKRERQTLAQTHKHEHEVLWRDKRAALAQAKRRLSEAFRPRWRALYHAQKSETVRLCGRKAMRRPPGLLRRAAFVLGHADRLSDATDLSLAEMCALILGVTKFTDRLDDRQHTERKHLAREQAVQKRESINAIMRRHDAKVAELKATQKQEREHQWTRHRKERDDTISFRQAKDELFSERAIRRPSSPQHP